MEILLEWLFVGGAIAFAAWFLYNTFTGKAAQHQCNCHACKLMEPDEDEASKKDTAEQHSCGHSHEN